MEQRASGFSSASMFLGIAVAGTALLIQTRLLEAYLSSSNFSWFLAWNAIYSIVGVLFASPLMTLSVRTWSANNSDEVEYQCVIWILILFVGSALLIGSASLFVSNGGHGIAFLALTIGGAFSAFSAFQRGVFGGTGKWKLLGTQQVLEGVFRLVFTTYLMSVKSHWVLGFISITVISQALAIFTLLPSFATVFSFRVLGKPSFPKIVSRVLPVWSNAIGLQVAFSLPIIVSFIKSPSGESDVVLVGLLFMLMRIPVSFAPSINAPKLAAVSRRYGHPINKTDVKGIFLSFRSQKSRYFIATIGSFFFGSSVLIGIFHIENWIALETCLICSFATSLILISQSITTVLIGINKLSWVLLIWFIGVLSLFLIPAVIGSSPLNMSFALLVMGANLILMHLLALSKLKQLN